MSPITSYTLNKTVGLHIKHSTARLPPWQFTLTKSNLAELFSLTKSYRNCFVAFVCGTDGIATLSIDEVAHIIDANVSERAWIRVDRSRRKQYNISGSGAVLPYKRNKGVVAIIEILEGA
jgi:hypothetical protein